MSPRSAYEGLKPVRPGNEPNIPPAAKAPNNVIKKKSTVRFHIGDAPSLARKNGRDAVAIRGTPRENAQSPNIPRMESDEVNPPPIPASIAKTRTPRRPENASRTPTIRIAISNANAGITILNSVFTAERMPRTTPAIGNANQKTPNSERKYVPSTTRRASSGDDCTRRCGDFNDHLSSHVAVRG